MIGIKNVHRSVLQIDTWAAIRIGLELKHDLNHTKYASQIYIQWDMERPDIPKELIPQYTI